MASSPPLAEFSPLHVTADWMHGPRHITRKVPLSYKPFMGKADLSIREEFGRHPVRFCLPPCALQGLEHFSMDGKRFARMPCTTESGLKPLIHGLYARVAELLNGQLARYSDRLRVGYHIPAHASDTFACRVREGSSCRALDLDHALVLRGRTLHLPFTLV